MESSDTAVPEPEAPEDGSGGGPDGPAQLPRPFTSAHTLLVAVALGVTSMSFNVWYPFLPLYALKLGATSDANALFWVAVANIAQGVTRLATGPVWGLLSDRFGRKMIFLRSLYLSCLTGAITGLITAPWQLTIALAVSGVFSGIIAPAVAFISVSVPESRLNSSLSPLSGAQYIGITAGPALGAVLAAIFGFRGAILVAAVVPLLTGAAVHLFV